MTYNFIVEKIDADLTSEDLIVKNNDTEISFKDTKKSFINYPTKDGEWISYRESKAHFAPSEEEFYELRKKIFSIIGIKTSVYFDDSLDYLITFLREQAYINVTMRSTTERRDELSRFSGVIKNLIDYMEGKYFNEVQNDLVFANITNMRKSDSGDAIHSMYVNAKKSLEMSDSTNQSLKGRKREFTPNTMRQILAEELARNLDRMGEKPTKYKNGNYFKILRVTLEMIPCMICEQRISISIPENLFKIASKAIDDYPTKEPYSLLNFD